MVNARGATGYNSLERWLPATATRLISSAGRFSEPSMAESSIEHRRLGSGPIVAATAVIVLLAATATLWAYYGTTVFFEVIRAGWAACF
jgi:hypothetical protein